MQATLLMLIALNGLGTQNPPIEPPPIMPIPALPAVALAPSSVDAFQRAWPVAPPCVSAVCSRYTPSHPEPFGKCARDTFCSFFIGRDPDVPSAREIQEAYCSGACFH